MDSFSLREGGVWAQNYKLTRGCLEVAETISSKIIVVSNLNKAYSSEGVPTLNVASKFEFPKSLVYTTVPQSPRSKNG